MPVWTARSLRVAGRYALPPLLAAIGLAAAGQRRAAAAVLAATAGVALPFVTRSVFPIRCEPGAVFAVTDGKVVLVRDGVHVPWLPGGPYRQVSVFLSLANVRVACIYPVSGTVVTWAFHRQEVPAGRRCSARPRTIGRAGS